MGGGRVAAVVVAGGQAALDALVVVFAVDVADLAAVFAPVRVAAVTDQDPGAVLWKHSDVVGVTK